jgi:hypothetical protein
MQFDPKLEDLLEALSVSHDKETDITNPGNLNYTITKIINAWLGHTPNYAKYNEVIGVLECAKLELYRRKVSEYEDQKCRENDDVYPKKFEFNPPA